MRTSKAFGRAGFTVIEMLLVVTITGITAAAGLPAFQDVVFKTRVTGTRAALGLMRSAILSEYTKSAMAGNPRFPDKIVGSMFQRGLGQRVISVGVAAEPGQQPSRESAPHAMISEIIVGRNPIGPEYDRIPHNALAGTNQVIYVSRRPTPAEMRQGGQAAWWYVVEGADTGLVGPFIPEFIGPVDTSAW